MEVGAKLKAARHQRQLTQAQLAEQLGVSVKTVSNWETGKTIPDVVMMLHLAKSYGLSLDDLLTEGSDWMDEIKAKERAARLHRWYLIGPLATNFVLMLMLFLPLMVKQLSMSDGMMVLLVVVILGNAITGWYMRKELAGDPWLRRVQRVAAVLMVLLWIVILAHQYL